MQRLVIPVITVPDEDVSTHVIQRVNQIIQERPKCIMVVMDEKPYSPIETLATLTIITQADGLQREDVPGDEWDRAATLMKKLQSGSGHFKVAQFTCKGPRDEMIKIEGVFFDDRAPLVNQKA